jgi:sortase A
LTRKTLQRVLFAIGVVLCLAYVGTLIYRSAGSRLGVRSFEIAKGAGGAAPAVPERVLSDRPSVPIDYSLWSAKRIAGYKDAIARQFAPPLAILRVPKLGIEVPVYDGTDEFVLNRGVGRIVGTSRVGQAGNVGIAGHRDGFFRGLKDIGPGDSLTLETSRDTETYVVDGITIVAPTDVSVLAQTPTPSLTLVTCYPFYFVGDAPRRYIVRCSLKDQAPARSASP